MMVNGTKEGLAAPEVPRPATAAEKILAPKSEYKLDPKSAEVEFKRFLREMDLDPSTDGLTADEKADKTSARKHFVKAIRRGSLMVDDKGQPVFTPQRKRSKYKEPITFYEPMGSTLQAMDSIKKNADVGKMYSAMAECTELDITVFSGLSLRDLDVCMAVFTLFLA